MPEEHPAGFSMKGVYSQLCRTYRIQGSFSEFWRASNGIIQGCSVSLLGLNSLTAAILEKADSIPRCLIGRAYADDISGEDSAEDPAELLQQTKNFPSRRWSLCLLTMPA